jgi:pimeloyl-ACP methyl ester carboxylesterase
VATWPRRVRLVATLSLVLLSACTSAFAGPGEFVAVTGGQVHLWCDGSGPPTIVFLSAVGGDDTLVPIAEQLTGDARVCFYHRPGDGDTEPPDGPRTAAEDAADLHELLAAAGIDTPAVLVAHSYGGLISVIAAATHPEETAGVVLVDGSQPNAEQAMHEVMTDAQRAYFDGRMASFPYVDWPTSLEQAGEAMTAFPDIPLTVITAARSFLEPCDEQLPCEALQQIWLDAQDQYAALTPSARHVVAETSHYVHTDDPDLVLSEIRMLLDQLE